MTDLTFIGDVHGKLAEYEALANNFDRTIQLGDMSILRPEIGGVDPEKHRYIRGNHDNPFAPAEDHIIPDGTYIPTLDTFCVGGAYSIDRVWRTAGFDWWPEEEIDDTRFDDIMRYYAVTKPRIVAAHDCPDFIARMFFDFYNEPNQSRTRKRFEDFMEIHQPEYWFFGHWHEYRNQKIGDTTFICLPELVAYTLEI